MAEEKRSKKYGRKRGFPNMQMAECSNGRNWSNPDQVDLLQNWKLAQDGTLYGITGKLESKWPKF
jgi:hypothetical protein